MSFEVDKPSETKDVQEKQELADSRKVETTEKLDETQFSDSLGEKDTEKLDEDEFSDHSTDIHEDGITGKLDEDAFSNDLADVDTVEDTELSSEVDATSWSDILIPNFVYRVKTNIERNQSMKLNQAETKVNGEYMGTPKVDSPAGHWTGVRGDSTFVTNANYVPKNVKMNPDHKTYGELGISEVRYKKGDIQLKPFAVDTEKINMTDNRVTNFELADAKFADKRGITIAEAKQYRVDHQLTWHERQDMKTIDLVPTSVNGTLRHTGGVAFISKDLKRSV